MREPRVLFPQVGFIVRVAASAANYVGATPIVFWSQLCGNGADSGGDTSSMPASLGGRAGCELHGLRSTTVQHSIQLHAAPPLVQMLTPRSGANPPRLRLPLARASRWVGSELEVSVTLSHAPPFPAESAPGRATQTRLLCQLEAEVQVAVEMRVLSPLAAGAGASPWNGWHATGAGDGPGVVVATARWHEAHLQIGLRAVAPLARDPADGLVCYVEPADAPLDPRCVARVPSPGVSCPPWAPHAWARVALAVSEPEAECACRCDVEADSALLAEHSAGLCEHLAGGSSGLRTAGAELPFCFEARLSGTLGTVHFSAHVAGALPQGTDVAASALRAMPTAERCDALPRALEAKRVTSPAAELRISAFTACVVFDAGELHSAAAHAEALQVELALFARAPELAAEAARLPSLRDGTLAALLPAEQLLAPASASRSAIIVLPAATLRSDGAETDGVTLHSGMALQMEAEEPGSTRGVESWLDDSAESKALLFKELGAPNSDGVPLSIPASSTDAPAAKLQLRRVLVPLPPPTGAEQSAPRRFGVYIEYLPRLLAQLRCVCEATGPWAIELRAVHALDSDEDNSGHDALSALHLLWRPAMQPTDQAAHRLSLVERIKACASKLQAPPSDMLFHDGGSRQCIHSLRTLDLAQARSHLLSLPVLGTFFPPTTSRGSRAA
jgi:hypothetical protein